tara:strand:- start:3258 stop:3650 length:393 start_codon:yes stop_codon:yes gene_type:complete
MNTTSITEGPYKTFTEETLAQLEGKEGYLVELGTAADSVKILATAANAIGTYVGKVAPGSSNVNVRLLGNPGTARFVTGGAVAKGGLFMAAAGGKVVAATSTNLAIGRSLYQGNTADGQVIEALPANQIV